jgi:hypothetical protein
MTTTSSTAALELTFSAADCPLTADEFRRIIAVRVGRGVDQAGDSFAFAPNSDGFTYGVDRWRFVMAELGHAFSEVPGARVINSGGMKVTVLPIGAGRTVLIYPLCFADDASTPIQHLKVRRSRLRALLFARGDGAGGLQMMLPGMEPQSAAVPVGDDDPEAASEDAAVEEIEAELAALPTLPRTIVVGYASNPDSGLLQLVAGEASMDSDGVLTFSWMERMAAGDIGPALLGADVSGDRFDAAPEPRLDVIAIEGDVSADDSDA